MDELRHFLNVVDARTFTAAAKHSHLSQPALTAAIQRLEATLGARLFDRGRRGASLTAAGSALLPHARASIAAIEHGKRAVRAIASLEAGEVRIGAGTTACAHLLPKPLARFRKKHPGVHLELRELTTTASREALAAGAIDLAIVSGGEGDLWMEDRVILVGAPDVKLEGSPFISFPKGAVTRSLVDRHFPDADVAVEISSVTAILSMVRAGMGVALLSEFVVRPEQKRGRLVELTHPDTPIARNIHIEHRGLELLPPAAKALREALLNSTAAP